MSTLIPLRSGAGVYVTLEEEEDEEEKTKHISFLAGDLCAVASQGAANPGTPFLLIGPWPEQTADPVSGRWGTWNETFPLNLSDSSGL